MQAVKNMLFPLSTSYLVGQINAAYCEDMYPEPCKMLSALGFCTQLKELAVTCRDSCGTCQIDEVALKMSWSLDDGSIDLGFAQPEPETGDDFLNCGKCLDSHPDFCVGFERQLKTECKKGHVREKCQRSCGVCTPDGNCPSFRPQFTSIPPQSYWGSWSLWTKCSKKCGTGVQFRRRRCRKDDLGNGCPAQQSPTDMRPCVNKKLCTSSKKSHLEKLHDGVDKSKCCNSVSIQSAVIDGADEVTLNFGVYKKIAGKLFNKRAIYKNGNKFLYCQPSRKSMHLKMWIVSSKIGSHQGDFIIEFESDAACPNDSPVGMWSYHSEENSPWTQDRTITVKCNDHCFDQAWCTQFSDDDNACFDVMVMNKCPVLCKKCSPN